VIVVLYVLPPIVFLAFPGRAQAAEILDVSRAVLAPIGGIVLGFHLGSIEQ
jgi:hypothetical protein